MLLLYAYCNHTNKTDSKTDYRGNYICVNNE